MLTGFPDAIQWPRKLAIRAAMAMAVCRSHSTTGRETRKPRSVCWHCGQASRPKASMHQPASIARARASPKPSAAGSACQEMQEPISHHMIGIRNSSPITARTVASAGSARAAGSARTAARRGQRARRAQRARRGQRAR